MKSRGKDAIPIAIATFIGGDRGVYRFQGMPSQERIRNSVREIKKVQKVKCQECGVYCVSSWIDGQWMWKHIVWMGHTPVMGRSVGVEI